MKIHSALAEVIKRHRDKITAAAISRHTGIGDSQLSLFFRGEKGLEYKNLSKLLEALPPEVYQEFCCLMAGRSAFENAEAAIGALSASDLTDEQIGQIMYILAARLQKTSKTQAQEDKTLVCA